MKWVSAFLLSAFYLHGEGLKVAGGNSDLNPQEKVARLHHGG
jgi:hypothetical protein